MMPIDYDPYLHLCELEQTQTQMIANLQSAAEIIRTQTYQIQEQTRYIKHISMSLDNQLTQIKQLQRRIEYLEAINE